MKIILFFLLVTWLTTISAQPVDSIVIKQVDSLIKSSKASAEIRDFTNALKLINLAEKLVLDQFGRQSASYGKICYTYGNFYFFHKFDYLVAEKWFLESKDISEKVLGKSHLMYANCLSRLGLVYLYLDQFEKSETFFLESINRLSKLLPNAAISYLECKGNLSILYQRLNQFEKAEVQLLEVIDIQGKTSGKNVDYIGNCINLSNLYAESGKFEKAEALLLESKSNLEKGLNTKHNFYMNCLNNLASLYNDLGQFEKAESLFLELKALNENVFKNDYLKAIILLNLALVSKGKGQNEKAENYLLEVVPIAEKVFGKESQFYGVLLNNLSNSYLALGKHEKAKEIILEAMSILDRVFGKENRDYIHSLLNMAYYYYHFKQYDKTEALLLEVVSYWEKAFGKEHYEYSHRLLNLADLYYDIGQYEKAASYYNSLAQLTRTSILNSSRFLSEKELNQYILTFEKRQAHILSLNHKLNLNSELTKTCFDNALFFKGYLLNRQNQSKHFILSDSSALEKFNLYKSYGRRLAIEYVKPIVERKDVIELEDKSNTLEKELIRTIAGNAEAKKQVSWKEVQQILDINEAAVEFIHYDYFDRNSNESVFYAALILLPSDTTPHFISLFEEKQLTKLLSINREGALISELYASRGATPIQGESLKGLYEIIWKPLDSILQGVKKIYFSPSGLLHRINIEAIPINNEIIFSDKFKLVRLGSTRSLVVPDVINVDSSNKVFLFGGIHYDTTFVSNNSASQKPIVSIDERISFSYINAELRILGKDWAYLPGTEIEIKAISKLFRKSRFNSTFFSGRNATEELFKNIGKLETSPRVLHISTHGYFFPDFERVNAVKSGVVHDTANSGERRSERTAKAVSPSPTVQFEINESVFKMSDHPMIRSGLILAGGNWAWKYGKSYNEGGEDGILTAYEISQMNLSNTELVVLSACETGLGDIQGNEGVYGLQRAFKIAGAKYLIMSLWQVPDKQTSLLMTAFYKKWLEENMTIPDAFHAAQKQLRGEGLEPYYWAGFVLVE